MKPEMKKTLLIIVILATLIISPTVFASPNSLVKESHSASSPVVYDNFDDNITDPSLWDVEQFGGPTITETNQRLEIAFPADSQGPTFSARYISTCQLRGDFDIQVEYDLLNWPYANGVRVGLVTGLGNVERTSFGSSSDFPGSPREVYLTNFGGSVQGIAATSDFSGILRQVREGNMVTGLYFDDGDWVTIYTAFTNMDDTGFRVLAWSHDYTFSDQEIELAFDNVIINAGEVVCPPTEVIIDIKAGIEPNNLYCSGGELVRRGVFDVAILTTDSFDARSVDHTTVTFEGASEIHFDWSTGIPHRHEVDVDHDGDIDVLFHFRLGETNLNCDSTEGVLIGETFDGISIQGVDSVRMVNYGW